MEKVKLEACIDCGVLCEREVDEPFAWCWPCSMGFMDSGGVSYQESEAVIFEAMNEGGY